MRTVLIQAGGMGLRVGENIPKQFISVKGKPVILHTLEHFQNSSYVDAIDIACLEGWHRELKTICNTYGISKVRFISAGGSNIFRSTRMCLEEIYHHNPNDDPLVLIHEAVRPLITEEMIEDSFVVAEEFGNAVACYRAIDEIGYLDNRKVLALSKGSNLFTIQNPHTFRLSKLIWAYNSENEPYGLQGTAILMNKLGETLYCSKGACTCFKITYEEDIHRFELLLG